MDIDDVLDGLGGNREAAQKLGQKRTAVCMWRRNGLPPRHAEAVAKELGVSIEEVWPAVSTSAKAT